MSTLGRLNGWMRALALATLMVLAACDPSPVTPGDDPQSRAIDPSDPCALLTADQVASGLGLEVTGAEEVESHPGPEGETVPLCLYETEKPYDSVTIHIESPVSRSEFRTRLKRDPPNTTELDGVGDLAGIHGGVSLSTLVGETVITITVQKFRSLGDTEVVLRNIAREAVRRAQQVR